MSGCSRILPDKTLVSVVSFRIEQKLSKKGSVRVWELSWNIFLKYTRNKKKREIKKLKMRENLKTKAN
jgi:hypothetical protein